MDFPERFSNLPEYAFPRLRALLDSHEPGGDVLAMSIGEPRHPMPEFVGDVIAQSLGEFGKYPANDGTPELLDAISGWLKRRYSVEIGPERIMALNGTREGLYNAAMALSPEQKRGKTPVIAIPNPFYQVYAVAAAAVGAEPVFVPAGADTGFLPNYSALAPEVLDRITVAYLCSPSNPQGAVASRDYLADLLHLAEKHDFIVFADECYSEIWREAPPPGAAQVAAEEGIDPERVVIFHSLSKRSNLPGLRSGFLAAGPQSIKHIRRLRAYAGAPLPQPLQRVAERAWADEAHVTENRRLYAEKYEIAGQIFDGVNGFQLPQGGFFLWLPVEDGEAAALKLWTETGIRVLPGAYLAREVNGENPGQKYIRVALVAPKAETQRGLMQLRDCLYG
ncbi:MULTISPECIES: aminotransferase class I/II-fold pyridoxal phosphate-dependent enzyme [Thioclava]|uniref:aminotransferase class I/II-fold pyridoxal phosphate-dependent enzyme n=1 Tax=Thioclava TaxID=285107 RepID=UPI000C3EA92A|nr:MULTISPECIES: aminotransferase class I/II-fold pyridoxal phosphate-dependent enzyme [Thioclava]MAQ38670.1 aspartate aminotransferase [Thioclava sp.]|tara:strand:- start:807 stop:1985 length:1179 start_codon:yes stop_codon:yes gene_type:complete